jgi:Fur family ferric uptake transcriptional regulator
MLSHRFDVWLVGDRATSSIMKSHRTRSQEQVYQTLQSLDAPISAQDLYLELRQRQHSMGLATVYRSLEALKKEGVLQVRTLATGESLYSLAHQDRHHLTCVQCHQSIPIEECPVHDLEDRLAQAHQFKVYYHTLEFFGLCQQCQSKTLSYS